MSTETTKEQSLERLIERVKAATGYDNKLDVEAEVALFKPGNVYTDCRPNSDGTKVIYTLANGRERVCWSRDYTMTAKSRAKTVRDLSSLKETSHDHE